MAGLVAAIALVVLPMVGKSFGVLGLVIADPLTAMLKVAPERRSERAARTGGDDAA